MISRIEYDEIWQNYKSHFRDVLELFRMYCGYGESFLSTRINFTHKAAVEEVVKFYLDKQRYLKNFWYEDNLHRYEHTVVCNIIYLLFQIIKNIPRDTIKEGDDISHIFELIKEKTAIDVNVLYDHLEGLTFHLGDITNPKQDVVESESWSVFVLKNIQYFPPAISEDEDDLKSHPVNLEWIKNLSQAISLGISDSLSFEKNTKLNGAGLLDVLMENDTGFSATEKNKNLYCNALSQLSHQHKEFIFEYAIKKGKHSVALDFFCMSEGLFHGQNLYIRCFRSEMCLLFEMLKSITKHVSNTLILSVIRQAKLFDKQIDDKMVDNVYLKLASVIHFIDDGGAVAKFYIENFNPHLYKMLLDESTSTVDVDNLLATNAVDLTNNSIISYAVDDFVYSREWREYGSYVVGMYVYSSSAIEKHVPKLIFNYKDEITMTPLQAILFWGSFHVEKYDHVKKIVLKIIGYNLFSINCRDSMGVGLEYYLDRYTSKLEKDLQAEINGIFESAKKTLLEKSAPLILLLLRQMNIDEASLIKIIFNMFVFAEETRFDNKNSLLGVFSPKIANLNHQHFYHLVRSEADQGYGFCLLSQFMLYYQFLSDVQYFQGLTVTESERFVQLCQNINKPVNGNFFLIYFDTFGEISSLTGSYRMTDYLGADEYLALINKREFISDWSKVESKFVKLFQPKIEEVIKLAFEQKNYKEILFFLKKAIESDVRGGYFPSYRINILVKKIYNHMEIDKSFLEITDNSGNDFIHYIRVLCGVSRKINNCEYMIKYYFSKILGQSSFNTVGLFFHHAKTSDDLRSSLPENVCNKIVKYSTFPAHM